MYDTATRSQDIRESLIGATAHHTGCWQRIAAVVVDLFVVWFCSAILWAPLALSVGDPIRFATPFGFGSRDDCGVWHEVSRTVARDATESSERLCTTRTFDLWVSYRVQHQEAHLDILTNTYSDVALYRWYSDAQGKPVNVVSNWNASCFAFILYAAVMLLTKGQTIGGRAMRVLPVDWRRMRL